MLETISKPTYFFEKPFYFMGKELKNSVELIEAFMENWDIAVSVFKRGDMKNFWSENVGYESEYYPGTREFNRIYNRMWLLNENVNEDILFQKVFYLIEPKADIIPVPKPGSTEMGFLDRIRFLKYIRDCFLSMHDDMFVEIFSHKLDSASKWSSEYDYEYEKLFMVYHMFREKNFNCWNLEYLQNRYENPKMADNLGTIQRKNYKTDKEYYVALRSILWSAVKKTEFIILSQWAFTLNNKTYYEEYEFFQYWHSHINCWSISELTSFINKLVCHQGNNSFADFILGCKKPEVQKKFLAFSEDWKERSKENLPYFNERDYLYLTDYTREKKWRSLKESQSKEKLKECLPRLEEYLNKLDLEIKIYQERFNLYERLIFILYELRGSTLGKHLYEKVETMDHLKKKIEERQNAYKKLHDFKEDLLAALQFLETKDFEEIWKHIFYEKSDTANRDLVKLFLFHNLCADFTEHHIENRKKFKEFYDCHKENMSRAWQLAIEAKVTF